MPVRLLFVGLHVLLFILSIVLQLSVMPIIFFGQPVVIHILFLLVVALLFLKEWQSSLIHLFFGMIVLTQLSEITTLPIIVSYSIGLIVFLFLSDFLLKSRSVLVFTINVLCAIAMLLLTHQLVLHLTLQTDQALLSGDNSLLVPVSIIIHVVLIAITAPGVLMIDQSLRKRELYVK